MCLFFLLGSLWKLRGCAVTCLGCWSRGGSHGPHCSVMSAPRLIGDQLGPNAARAMLSDLIWADLCHPFSPLSCNHISHWLVSWSKQLISIYCADCVSLPWPACLRSSPDTYLMYTSSCEVTDRFSADQFVWSRSSMRNSEHFYSSRQMCSHMDLSHIYPQCSPFPAQIGSLHTSHLLDDTTVSCKCLLL